MLVFDVNVLLACFRGDHPQHEVVYPWWRSILDEETSFHVPDTVWAVSYTHLDVYKRQRLKTADVLAYADRRRTARARALEEMVSIGADAGLYDDDF